MAALITRTCSLLLYVLIVVVPFVVTMGVKLVFFMVDLLCDGIYSIIELILVFLWYFVSVVLFVLSQLRAIIEMIQSVQAATEVLLNWSFKVLSFITSTLLSIGSHLFYLIKKISDGLIAVSKLVTTMSVKLFFFMVELVYGIID